MGRVTVILVDEANVEIHEVPVEIDTIKEAAILQFRGHYYTYQSQSGRFLTKPKFQRVNPPVDLEKAAL